MTRSAHDIRCARCGAAPGEDCMVLPPGTKLADLALSERRELWTGKKAAETHKVREAAAEKLAQWER